MKRVLTLLIVILSLLFAGELFAASCTNGTVTKTIKSSTARMLVVQYDIDSDASGDVSGGTNCEIDIEKRYLYKVEIWPDTGGTIPSPLYDCRFNTPLGVDIMQGELQDLPQLNTVSTGTATPLIGGAAIASYGCEKLDIVCANMGDTQGTTMDIHFYKE